MEVHHKIKPPHGWREFVFEVLIIVFGVLLALGAEQAVEGMHRAHQVEEAEAAIRIELTTDDGPQAFVRAASAPCFTAQLKAMREALQAGADRKAFYELAQQYSPPRRSWDSEAWKSLVGSGVGAYMGADRLHAWGAPYTSIPRMDEIGANEMKDMVDLLGGRRSAGKLSDAETDRMLQLVDHLYFANRSLAGLSLGILDGMAKINVTLTPADQQRLLNEARQTYGACVQAPDVRIWSHISQTTDSRKLKLPF